MLATPFDKVSESERKSAPMSRASESWLDRASKGRLFRKSSGAAARDVVVDLVGRFGELGFFIIAVADCLLFGMKLLVVSLSPHL